MAKTYIDTVKYLVYTDVEVDGLVDKPDVVGAIFGQTEGLLGDELDLRDLQKNGRIGRIEVDLKGQSGKTVGMIKIPSSLDMVETCIIAAALETVDRVGPCEAKLKVTKVEDTRSIKRKVLLDRAKNLLRALVTTEIPESREITEMVRDEIKTAEIVEYGPERLPAGPMIDKSNELVLVEGRADVINMLKNDITNVIAIQGAKVPRSIVELSKRKEVTIFLDGDRGGDIILNELIQGGVDIDFITRAPTGLEVEELTRKELIKCLRNKVPFEQGGEGASKMARRRKDEKKEGDVEEENVWAQKITAEKVQIDSKTKEALYVQAAEYKEQIKKPAEAPREQPRYEEKQFQRPNEEHGERPHQRPLQQVPMYVPSQPAPQPVKMPPKPAPSQAPVQKHEQPSAPVVDGPTIIPAKENLLIELNSLSNTLNARFYNNNHVRVAEVPVRDVIKRLSEIKDVKILVFDGIITQRLVDLAAKQGVKTLVGIKTGNVNKMPEGIEVIIKN